MQKGETLNEALRRLNYTTRPGLMRGRKDILSGESVVLRNKTAGDVWRWLKNRKKESARS